VAGEVDDLVRTVHVGAQFRVPSGNDQVVDDQVVVAAAADADGGAGGQRVYGRGPPEGAGRGGQGDGGRALGGLGGLGGGRRPAGEYGARAVGGVAEAQDAAGADVPRLDAAAVGVRTVRAVLVLELPVTVFGPQHRVVPGHPGVVDDDVAQRVAPHVIGPARAHHHGTRLGLEDEFGRNRPLSHA
jgi:hypothetical protein